MATGEKPPIAILMAVYEPRMDWLREQLDSLNAQTYPNLRLYVRDDCSPTVPFGEIKALIAERVTAFPYTLARNEKNLGSNKTFERLTAEAEGEYFSYCDQDDVWLPRKTAVLAETLERERAQLVCSDMRVIDGEGRRTAESITEVNRRQRFRTGDDLKMVFLKTNFVTGTAMMIRADTAKAAIPFSPYTVHDWYLALYASRLGRIVGLTDKLMDYRIHGGNQTIPMKGVHDRESYREKQILRRIAEAEWLKERFAEDRELSDGFAAQLKWLTARRDWMSKGGAAAARELWRGRGFGLLSTAFELTLAHAPESVFMKFVDWRKNVL